MIRDLLLDRPAEKHLGVDSPVQSVTKRKGDLACNNQSQCTRKHLNTTASTKTKQIPHWNRSQLIDLHSVEAHIGTSLRTVMETLQRIRRICHRLPLSGIKIRILNTWASLRLRSCLTTRSLEDDLLTRLRCQCHNKSKGKLWEPLVATRPIDLHPHRRQR